MLVLTFWVQRTSYAVPVTQVIEVVPRVSLRPIPHAPLCLLGLLHYRGVAVPVIDLGLLLGGVACVERLATRILLVRGSLDGQIEGELGLVAEQVNELVTVDSERIAMRPPGFPQAPYLGRVFETDGGLLQLIDPDRIALASVVNPTRMVES